MDSLESWLLVATGIYCVAIVLAPMLATIGLKKKLVVPVENPEVVKLKLIQGGRR